MSTSLHPSEIHGRCGCPIGFDVAEEFKTCRNHEVIFCRKCEHADSTLHYPPNTRIKCRECLGRSTLSRIWEKDHKFTEAVNEVKRYKEKLKEVHKQGKSGEVTKSRLAKAKQRREEHKQASKTIVIEETGKFTQHYGRFDWMEWHCKLRDRIPVDAVHYEKLPRKLYFKSRPDDIHSEKEEKAKLADIVGDLNNPHKPKDQIVNISDEERSSLSSLYELYLKQTVEQL